MLSIPSTTELHPQPSGYTASFGKGQRGPEQRNAKNTAQKLERQGNHSVLDLQTEHSPASTLFQPV
jgi:hypothetical protein